MPLVLAEKVDATPGSLAVGGVVGTRVVAGAVVAGVVVAVVGRVVAEGRVVKCLGSVVYIQGVTTWG